MGKSSWPCPRFPLPRGRGDLTIECGGKVCLPFICYFINLCMLMHYSYTKVNKGFHGKYHSTIKAKHPYCVAPCVIGHKIMAWMLHYYLRNVWRTSHRPKPPSKFIVLNCSTNWYFDYNRHCIEREKPSFIWEVERR